MNERTVPLSRHHHLLFFKTELVSLFLQNSYRMSGAADPPTSKHPQGAPADDVSSPPLPPPPPYSYQEQLPPPYSAAPAMYPASKEAASATHQATATCQYVSFSDICPEAPSDTTPLIASSSFDDKSVRRGFVRKVCMYNNMANECL